MTDQNRPVSSSSRASNYAPARVREAAVRTALRLQEGRLREGHERAVQGPEDQERPYGRKGDERTKIVVCEEPSQFKNFMDQPF